MYDFAMKHIRDNRPKWCKICTYGIYINYKSSEFINTLRMYNVDTTIVVGDTGLMEERVEELQDKYPNIKFRLVDEMHAKCILFSDRLLIAGSMNLSNSGYEEIEVVVKLRKEEFVLLALHIDEIS